MNDAATEVTFTAFPVKNDNVKRIILGRIFMFNHCNILSDEPIDLKSNNRIEVTV